LCGGGENIECGHADEGNVETETEAFGEREADAKSGVRTRPGADGYGAESSTVAVHDVEGFVGETGEFFGVGVLADGLFAVKYPLEGGEGYGGELGGGFDEEYHGGSVYKLGVERGSVEDGTGEGDFVGILDTVPDGDASRQDGDGEGVRLQAAVEEEVGGVAVHRGAEGEDDFGDASGGDTGDEAVYLKVVGADAVDGRDASSEDVVEAVILAGVLDGHHFPDALDDADEGGVALRGCADGTEADIADVVAEGAVTDVLPEGEERNGEPLGVIRLATEDVQGEAQGCFPADAGEGGKLSHGSFEEV
jgi:hypothetical protein